MRAAVVLIAAALTITACSGGDGSRESPQAQPPVIVVQAPPLVAEGATTGYGNAAWPTAAPTVEAAPPEEVSQDPDAEPYEVVALLREFDPHLTDAPKDQTSAAATDDLLSAFVVMDDKYLYGRMASRAPMTGDTTNEARFWLEQDGDMVTVEIKVGTSGRPCELSDVKTSDAQKVVTGCFWTGTALDFRMPLDSIPATIDLKQPYWVSGFQTCCEDEGRNNPFDSIDGAQEVWRVTGLAAEIDIGGDGPAPGDAGTVPTGG